MIMMAEEMEISLATPRDWWRELDEEFHFTLDAAASDEFHLCDNYMTEEDNAFSLPWEGVVWCSPPWGEEELGAWVLKGVLSAARGATVVMLLPVRHLAGWHRDYVGQSSEIRIIDGQLEFVPMSHVPEGAFLNIEAHMLIVFREGEHGAKFSTYPAR